MKPLVSIIIPTYNRAHLIGETLNSVLAQTYTNWECIVVDDGSTDNTDDVLAAYCKKDNRFQYHHRPNYKPKGANACRNYGLELSKGEYVNWFDSDDLMMLEKLEIQVSKLHNSSYDYTICQTMMYNVATSEEIGLRAPKLYSNNIFEDYISFKIFWLTGAPLWKKKFLEVHKLTFDETLHQAQDYDFHIRVLDISENYLPIEKVFVLFKQHNGNMSNSRTDLVNKIDSNLNVKMYIINNFKIKLDKEIIIDIYRDLFQSYKNHTKNERFNYSRKILKFLINNIDILPYNLFEKLYFIGRSYLAYLSYFLFSKGDKFLKFDI